MSYPTDRGGQYAGNEYRGTLARARMSQSMSRADNCYDNAFMESCFGRLNTELPISTRTVRHTGAISSCYTMRIVKGRISTESAQAYHLFRTTVRARHRQ